MGCAMNWATATTRERVLFALGILIACISFLILAAIAASENGADDAETEQRTALSVADFERTARQVEADELFQRRVQMTGDAICLRTAGPGTRAVWQGSYDTLHCVPRGQSSPRDRLMLADGGVR